MDLIIKVYNQYFRNVDSQCWKYVGYQYWYNVRNWCCTNAVHRYHFDYPPTVGFRQSEVGIQRRIDVGPIVNFCLGSGLYGGSNITSQPSLNNFWWVNKDVCDVALSWWKITHLRLTNSGPFSLTVAFNLFNWRQ